MLPASLVEQRIGGVASPPPALPPLPQHQSQPSVDMATALLPTPASPFDFIAAMQQQQPQHPPVSSLSLQQRAQSPQAQAQLQLQQAQQQPSQVQAPSHALLFPSDSSEVLSPLQALPPFDEAATSQSGFFPDYALMAAAAGGATPLAAAYGWHYRDTQQQQHQQHYQRHQQQRLRQPSALTTASTESGADSGGEDEAPSWQQQEQQQPEPASPFGGGAGAANVDATMWSSEQSLALAQGGLPSLGGAAHLSPRSPTGLQLPSSSGLLQSPLGFTDYVDPYASSAVAAAAAAAAAAVPPSSSSFSSSSSAPFVLSGPSLAHTNFDLVYNASLHHSAAAAATTHFNNQFAHAQNQPHSHIIPTPALQGQQQQQQQQQPPAVRRKSTKKSAPSSSSAAAAAVVGVPLTPVVAAIPSTKQACIPCRKLKASCDGCRPCMRCIKFNRECVDRSEQEVEEAKQRRKRTRAPTTTEPGATTTTSSRKKKNDKNAAAAAAAAAGAAAAASSSFSASPSHSHHSPSDLSSDVYSPNSAAFPTIASLVRHMGAHPGITHAIRPGSHELYSSIHLHTCMGQGHRDQHWQLSQLMDNLPAHLQTLLQWHTQTALYLVSFADLTTEADMQTFLTAGLTPAQLESPSWINSPLYPWTKLHSRPMHFAWQQGERVCAPGNLVKVKTEAEAQALASVAQLQVEWLPGANAAFQAWERMQTARLSFNRRRRVNAASPGSGSGTGAGAMADAAGLLPCTPEQECDMPDLSTLSSKQRRHMLANIAAKTLGPEGSANATEVSALVRTHTHTYTHKETKKTESR